MTGHLDLWTICWNPEDYRGKYTARRSEVRAGASVVTDEVIVADTLPEIRQDMQDLGLVCLARDPNDDPVIVEVWL